MWYLFPMILIQAAFPTIHVVLRQILFSHYLTNKEQHEESTEECKKDLGSNLSKVSFQQWSQLSQHAQLSPSCSLTQLCFKPTLGSGDTGGFVVRSKREIVILRVSRQLKKPKTTSATTKVNTIQQISLQIVKKTL